MKTADTVFCGSSIRRFLSKKKKKKRRDVTVDFFSSVDRQERPYSFMMSNNTSQSLSMGSNNTWNNNSIMRAKGLLQICCNAIICILHKSSQVPTSHLRSRVVQVHTSLSQFTQIKTKQFTSRKNWSFYRLNQVSSLCSFLLPFFLMNARHCLNGLWEAS